MGVFLGTALSCFGLAWSAVRDWGEAGAGCRLAGSLCYLVGTIGVTLAFNVPLNDALAGVQPSSLEAAHAWPAYVASWTTWNHVRGFAALLAAALFMLALLAKAAAPKLPSVVCEG